MDEAEEKEEVDEDKNMDAHIKEESRKGDEKRG